MKRNAERSQKQREGVGQVVKFSSSGLHLSKPFHDVVSAEYKPERHEQVHIYTSETAGELYSYCFFLYLMRPQGNLTSVVKHSCLSVRAQTLCVCLLSKTHL